MFVNDSRNEDRKSRDKSKENRNIHKKQNI